MSIITKKKRIEKELGVELPAEVIGMEIAPESGAVIFKTKEGKKDDSKR